MNDKAREICAKLMESLTSMLEAIEAKRDVTKINIEKMIENGQFLAAILKKDPSLIDDSSLFETLELIGSINETEYPYVFEHFSKILRLCLRVLPTGSLVRLWSMSKDIRFCLHILSLHSVENHDLFNKICYWVEHPDTSIFFFRSFVQVLKTKTETVDADRLMPLIPHLTDPTSPLRSTLAMLVFQSFTAINSRVAIAIAAAWLTQQQHKPFCASHCRMVLSTAPPNVLNLLATLTLEWPVVLAIVPSTTNGFENLAMITTHRVKTFSPSLLPNFLELCDISVRRVARMNDSLPKPLQLLDAAFATDTLSNTSLESLFTEPTPCPDFFAASLLFGRHTSLSALTFIPPAVKSQIVAALQSPADPPPLAPPSLQTNLDAVADVAEFLHSNQISRIHAYVHDSVT